MQRLSRNTPLLALIVAIMATGTLVCPSASAETVSIDLPAAPVSLISAELQLTVAFDTVSVTPPATALLTFLVTNTGVSTAKNVVITNTLPVEFAYRDVSASAALGHLGDLAPGDTITKSLSITIPVSATTDRYIDEAIASATNANSVQTDAALNVTNGKVLGVSTIEPLLALTGTSPVDYFIFVLGAVAVAWGIRKLRPLR